MSKYERTCIVCGKVTEYCPYCAQYAHMPNWHTIYCSENCKELFDIVSNYKIGKLTDDEVNEQVLKCDLSYKDRLNVKIRETIEKFESKPELIEEPVKITYKPRKRTKQAVVE